MPPKVLMSLSAWLGSIWSLWLIPLLPTYGRNESPGKRLQATPQGPPIPETGPDGNASLQAKLVFHLLNHRNFKKDERVCLNLEGKEPLSPAHTHLLIGCEWRDVWKVGGVSAVTGTVALDVPSLGDHTAGPGEGQWAGVVWGSPAHHLWGSL